MDIKGGIEIKGDEKAAAVIFKSATITDTEQIQSFQGQIKEFVENNHPRIIAMNFSNVRFFSSGILGLLLDIRAKAGLYGGKILVSGLSPQLRRIFEVTNLERVFAFYPDIESAMKSAGKN